MNWNNKEKEISSYAFDFIESSKLSSYDFEDFNARVHQFVLNQELQAQYFSHSIELGNTKKHFLVKEGSVNAKSDGFYQLNRERNSKMRKKQPLSYEELSNLLLRSYFVHDEVGHRFNIPSAGGLYPIEIFVLNIGVSGLPLGAHHYNPFIGCLSEVAAKNQHELKEILKKAFRNDRRVDLDIENSSAVVILTATSNRTSNKYGDRGMRFVFYEAGAVMQNICLTATALEICCCVNGGFVDNFLHQLLGLKGPSQTVLLTMVIS